MAPATSAPCSPRACSSAATACASSTASTGAEGRSRSILDQIELVEADVRDMPATALDGVDGVIHLAGLSNDPTAEYDPEANWQMNAIATETLGRNCVDRDIERSCSPRPARSTTGCPRACTTRRRRSSRAVPTRPPSATARKRCSRSLDEGLCPVILRNGTVYGYSPRMRFDLVVNTFVKDALLRGQLSLHGGGWMWRPLVDVRDVADAMIAAIEAPAELVRGEIFNVLHSNYQIRELAMLVAGSVQLLGRSVTLKEEPAPRLTRDYECSNAKLAEPPRVPSVAVRWSRRSTGSSRSIDVEDRTMLTDPRFYNIRWLELLHELTPQIDQFRAAL